MMLRDLRATALYREIAQFCSDVRQPGSGRISDCAQMHCAPGGDALVFAATIVDHAEQEPMTRLALADPATGDTRLIAPGPGNARQPKFSPDGRRIAFLSDRAQPGLFQLLILERDSGEVRTTPIVDGTVEWLHWSADGTRILLGAVGIRPGDRPAAQTLPDWLPQIDPDRGGGDWRSCWILDLASHLIRQVTTDDCSVWSAAWRGAEQLILLASDRPGEDDWYSATLRVLDLATGRQRSLYAPQDQLGAPVVSPSGSRIAVVEALCSDRGPVTGDLRIVDAHNGLDHAVDTQGVDVQIAEWQSEDLLLVAGYRGFETVVGLCDIAAGSFAPLWSTVEHSITGLCLSALPVPGDFAVAVEGFGAAPRLMAVRNGQARMLCAFDAGYEAAMAVLGDVDRVTWVAPDGLEIQGWLLRPHGHQAPHALVMDVHGGPIGHWRPAFLARRMLHVPALLRRGYAVFLPNPRGSTGRGQPFARRVLGDLGGADAQDLLSGLDALIARGLADPARIAVTGVSYGGFMAAWLATQSDRFSAAVAVSPHTNQLTAQLLSNIPQFMSRLLSDDYGDPSGRYFSRSPVLHVRPGRAPVLNICGALDRCTPPGEAIQFHRALLEQGNPSVLISYPREGHGIRRLPAALDCAARVVGWFAQHMPLA